MSTQDASALIAGAGLVYVSDYFSFVGADEHGRVAFAIDNNRGRDGDAFPAEHLYIVLHDERRGWTDLAGQGRYENTTRELLPIPDSPTFRFVGQPLTRARSMTLPCALTQWSSVSGAAMLRRSSSWAPPPRCSPGRIAPSPAA